MGKKELAKGRTIHEYFLKDNPKIAKDIESKIKGFANKKPSKPKTNGEGESEDTNNNEHQSN